jgi:hypothetical protein
MADGEAGTGDLFLDGILAVSNRRLSLEFEAGTGDWFLDRTLAAISNKLSEHDYARPCAQRLANAILAVADVQAEGYRGYFTRLSMRNSILHYGYAILEDVANIHAVNKNDFDAKLDEVKESPRHTGAPERLCVVDIMDILSTILSSD